MKLIVKYSASDGISLAGLALSCLALYCIFNEAVFPALAFLYGGILCDAYDGWLARKTEQLRPFGKFLDTNIDVITHLMVPLILFWRIGFDAWYQLLILLIVLICGISRLAVFNEKGFVQDPAGNSAYWGTPVFWCPIWIGFFIISAQIFTEVVVHSLASIALLGFAISMLRAKPAYKPDNMVGITLLLTGAMVLWLCWDSIPESVWRHLQLTVLMSLPLWVACHFNLAFAKLNLMKSLNIPLQRQWFGDHKTWRGLVTLVLGTIIAVWLLQQLTLSHLLLTPGIAFAQVNVWLFGALLGLAFILGELPNSFIKRRLNIAPGQTPATNKAKIAVIVADQIDSAWPVVLLYGYFFGYPIGTIFTMFITLPVTFFLFRIYFFTIGLKQSPLR